MSTSSTLQTTEWKPWEKAVFRFLFIYFLLQALPLDWKYYAHVFSINWLNLQFSDIFYLSRYTPQPVTDYSPNSWKLANLADWAVIALIALIGAVIWSFADKRERNYPVLNYWLRTILRYRLAIGILAYGFIKVFPLQAPYPSISNLNTAYGEFTRWKLFAMSLGIVPGYETFLGLVEVLAGLLLLSRKTASFGALVILLFTGNVLMSNMAYEGGEGIYSLYLIVIALYIIAYDVPRLYRLITLRKPTAPASVKPVLQQSWQRNGLVALKSLLIFFFVVLYAAKTYAAYKQDGYHYPTTKGLPKAAGLYDVTEFKIKGQVHPYSDTDSTRWQNVVFEKWATISIKTLQPQLIDSAVTEEIHPDDFQRDYELAGSGERSYYSYTIDATKSELYLVNKNSHYPQDRFTLHYTRPDSLHIILSGINQQQDSVYAVLTRINKKYLLKEAAKGRNKGLKL
ncbi:DoxX family protein [Mucilaginibacter sp. Bleaf8]|uniref:DoxX family protein n=1 Tax=Mucilaginibacter sp. Bleaf8 TaxID=2834430 RepID=UPI001BCE6392|nr:DoxX family protein [Mucilaginibacter sp. Bleaf8]MBS7563802.1 DoxX family protein [Mucilaginibacter sp. Bleaf8]